MTKTKKLTKSEVKDLIGKFESLREKNMEVTIDDYMDYNPDKCFNGGAYSNTYSYVIDAEDERKHFPYDTSCEMVGTRYLASDIFERLFDGYCYRLYKEWDSEYYKIKAELTDNEDGTKHLYLYIG